MAGDTSKFIVEFQAEVKKLKAAMAELKQYQSSMRSDTKKDRVQDKRGDREKDRDRVKVRKAEEKSRKEERKHVLLMQKEEGKRHKATIGAVSKVHNEQQRLMKKNAALEKQLMRAGGRGAGGAGQQGKQAGRGGGFWGGLGLGVGISNLLGGAFNMLVGGAQAGYQKYMEYGQAKSRSIGVVSGKQFKKGMKGSMGGALGYSVTDTANMMPIMARATGEAAPREMQQGARSTGLEAGEVGDIFGTLRRAGYDFKGAGKGKQSAGGKEFQKLISAGFQSGLEHARFPEFAAGVQQIAEQNRMLTTGNVNVGDIAKQLAMWGKSTPGLQGAAGANLFGKVTGGIGAPGGGEWGEAFMRQAAGFGKPGGTTGFYEAEKKREAGARGDPEMIMNVMKEFKSQFGGFGGAGKEEASLAMRETLGTTLEQNERLQKIYESTDSAADQQKKIEAVMEESKSLEQQAKEAMVGLGDTAKRIATLTNRGVDIGAKAAPFIEKAEDWQFQMLQYLISIAQDIAKLYQWFKDNWPWKSKEEKDAGRQLTESARLRQQLVQAQTPEEQQEIAAKLRASTEAAKKSAKATGSKGYSIVAEDEAKTASTAIDRQSQYKKYLARYGYDDQIGKDTLDKWAEGEFPKGSDVIFNRMQDMKDEENDAAPSWLNKTAPSHMRNRKKRGRGKTPTDSGTVSAAPASGSSGASGTADTSEDRNLTVQVVSPNARDNLPTQVVQRPGAPRANPGR